MCKCVILLPLFATLLLTDEDPYVDVDVINLALIRLVQRETEVKTKRLRLKPSSLAICAFPAVSLNIYLPLKTRSSNESRLFPGNRHSGG